MKQFMILLAGVLLLAGCGQPSQEAKPSKPAGPQRDFLSDGIQHLKESDVKAAIASFDEAIKNDPLNPQGYVVLGQVYMHMKNFDRAIDTFSAAIRVAPENGEAYYFLAMSQGLAGHREAAIDSAQKSVDMFRVVQDEENFKRSLVLLQGLMQTEEPVIQQ